MSWRVYLLLAVAVLIVMAFKLTKVLAIVIFLSVALVIVIAYFSKKGDRSGKA
ncbi:MAG: hypothetical protein ABDH16_07935 [Thermodesulfovibrionaceae bacterium]